MMRLNRFLAVAAGVGLLAASSQVHATPYASGITVTGTTVTYILNADADALDISINGGAFSPAPDGTLRGTHTFNLTSPTDTFSIRADKTENGFTSTSGGTVPVDAGGRGQAYPTAQANEALISSLTNPLTHFNSPRGLSVSINPNATNFGRTYIANSAASTTPPGSRTGNLGDGIYVVNADQSDGFGYGDVAQGSGTLSAAASTNTPYKITVANDGDLYVAGYGDAISGVWRMSENLTTIDQVFGGTLGFGTVGSGTCDGTTNTAAGCLPVGQNHGSVLSVAVTGSTATNDLTLYTIDEDFTNAQFTRANNTDPKGTDTNKILRYDIGGSSLPYTTMPTVFSTPLIPGFVINPLDIERGADGKFYVSQLRAQPANTSALFVLDANGNVIFNSVAGTAAIKTISTPAGDYNHDGTKNAGDYVIWRKQQGTAGPDADGNGDTIVDTADYDIWRNGNPALTGGAIEAGFGDVVNDFYTQIFAISVSPDQKWLAALHNDNTLTVTPLVNGIPDVANALALNTGATGSFSARDISFDAAGNLHIVSSGTGRYVVLAPGGATRATTSWNGSSYSFNVGPIVGSGSLGGGGVPEPGTLVLAMTGIFLACAGRRRR